MIETTSLGSRDYFVYLLCLLITRGLDYFSTWLATPTLRLEANPIIRKLGWEMSVFLNLAVIIILALVPIGAIAISTASALAAARNLNLAWLSRTMGEISFSEWITTRLSEAQPIVYGICVILSSIIYISCGLVLLTRDSADVVVEGIGGGFIAYGVILLVYTLSKARLIIGKNRHIKLVKPLQKHC